MPEKLYILHQFLVSSKISISLLLTILYYIRAVLKKEMNDFSEFYFLDW